MQWLNSLRQMGRQESYKAGHILFSELSACDGFYVVVSGAVGIFAGKKRICDVEPGGFVGVEALFSDVPSHLTAVVEKESVLIKVSKANTRLVAAAQADFSGTLLSSLSTLVRELSLVISPPEAAKEPLSAPSPVSAPSLGLSSQSAPPLGLSSQSVPEPAPEPEKKPPALVANTPGAFALYPERHKKYDKTAPESWSSMLVVKKYDCPGCHKEFTDATPLSYKLKTKEIAYDMRTIYDNFEILWYSARVCPFCNIAALTNAFPKLNARDVRFLASNRYVDMVPKFKGFSERRTVDEVFDSYYTVLACIGLSTKDVLSEAQVWRRLMWLYSDMEDSEMEEYATDKTLEKYAETFQTRTLGSAEEEQLNIILGDLYQKKGNRANAYKHYMNVVQAGKTGSAGMYKHASDAIQDMRT